MKIYFVEKIEQIKKAVPDKVYNKMKSVEAENIKLKRQLEEMMKEAKRSKIDENESQNSSKACTSTQNSLQDDEFETWAASNDFLELSQNLSQIETTPIVNVKIKKEGKQSKKQ